jgi:hypothetical protein
LKLDLQILPSYDKRYRDSRRKTSGAGCVSGELRGVQEQARRVPLVSAQEQQILEEALLEKKQLLHGEHVVTMSIIDRHN